MRESRVSSTRVLAEAIARAERPAGLPGPERQLGYYGDHGDEVVTEESDSRGDAFLTVLTRDWQAAADPALRRGCPGVRAADRAGDGPRQPAAEAPAPALQGLPRRPARRRPAALPGDLAARLGRGGRPPARAPAASGPFNMCAPETPTNAEFTRALARAVHRPAFLAARSRCSRWRPGRWRRSCSARSTCARRRWRRPATGSGTATWTGGRSPPGSALTARRPPRPATRPDTRRSEITRVDGRSRGQRAPDAAAHRHGAPTSRSVTCERDPARSPRTAARREHLRPQAGHPQPAVGVRRAASRGRGGRCASPRV